MMKAVLLTTVFCLLITSCFATCNLFKCHPVKPVSAFDLKKFSTVWYEIDKSSPLDSPKQKCTKANITAINSTDANYESYTQNIWTNKPETGKTSLHVINPKIPGVFQLGPRYFRDRTNYTVIDVSYNNYVVIHACTRIKCIFEFEQAWILSSKPTLNKTIADASKKKLASFGFNVKHFTAVDQLNC